MSGVRPNQRWAVARKRKGLSLYVRERASNEIIGGLIHLRSRGGMGKKSGYLATRVNGEEREFATQFDACWWLLQAFDNAQEKAAQAMGRV